MSRTNTVSRRAGLGLVAAACLTTSAQLLAGPVLDGVRERGEVRCGTRDGVQGFAYVDENGQHSGFDVDFCKAVAVALFGDPGRVSYSVLSAQERLPALKEDRVDVLIGLTTWTYSRDADGVDFVGANFYDGQGFLARRNAGLRTILSVRDGTKACVGAKTTSESNLRDYVNKHKLGLEVVTKESTTAARDAFYAGECELFSSDRTQLSVAQVEADEPGNYLLLPDVISKEPLGPAVKEGDQAWSDIVRWVLFATIEAEERGIDSGNVASMRSSADPVLQFMLGASPGVGEALGLDDQWVARVIRAVGNYGEIFDRNLGSGGQLKMPRGINDLWSRGGLMYSPPLR